MTKHEWAKRWLKEKDEVIALSCWTIFDVMERAKDLGKTVTKEDVEKILFMIDKKQDANIGINWDVLDYWIDRVLENGKE